MSANYTRALRILKLDSADMNAEDPVKKEALLSSESFLQVFLSLFSDYCNLSGAICRRSFDESGMPKVCTVLRENEIDCECVRKECLQVLGCTSDV